jgi:hypothetical protein
VVRAQDYAGSKWGKLSARAVTDTEIEKEIDEGDHSHPHLRPTWHLLQ